MQPAETDVPDIADIIARRFLELKQDMDKIIVQSTDSHAPLVVGDAVQTPSTQQEDLPVLELHGRLYSATQGHDDCPLPPDSMLKLPEAIPEATQTVIPTVDQPTAEPSTVQLSRRAAIGTDGSDSSVIDAASTAPSDELCAEPTAEGPCRRFSNSSAEEEMDDHEPHMTATAHDRAEKPWATSQLSYKELLEKALGGYDPRLPQQKQPSLRKLSSVKKDALATSQGHNSTPSKEFCRSKFPGAMQQQKRSHPAAHVASSSASSPSSSLRIFKQGSGSARKLLEQLEADQLTPAVDSQEGDGRRSSDRDNGSRRCRSAPREQAAEAAHVRRMSPGVTAADGQLRSAGSPSRGASEAYHGMPAGGSPGYIERLYASGVEKQHRRARAPDRRSLSPVRLTEDEWKRVTNRLYNDALNKEERMRMRREKEECARDEAMHTTAGGNLADRVHNVRRSRAHAVGTGSKGPESAFYDRQRALLDRRAERAKQRRPSGEFSPEEKTECTFHPKINASSRHLYRSVDDMCNWELHRKLHVAELQSEKTSHEFDDYTFMPEINDLSRKLALQSYAAAPDPSRWWTHNPVHITAPDMRQYSPPRSASPKSPTVDSAAKHDSIAGLHMYYADGSPLLTGHLMAASKPNQGLWSAPSAVGGTIQSSNSPAVSHQRYAVPQHLQEDVRLPAGVVMGVPIGSPAQQVPEDAVVIQIPGAAGGSQTAHIGPVAPGDGVAFIRLSPIRTSVPQAVAATVAAEAISKDDERQRQVVSPVQAQMGLEQGLGSGDWLKSVAAASLTSKQHDSATSTPVYKESASFIPSKHTAVRTFRDDSAGGYGSPTKKLSSGGTWFAPVTMAQKSSPLAKPKQADGVASYGRLQPSLSDATRAAIELSHQLGLREPSEGQIANYAASAAANARQQAVPAYYVAVDSRDSQLRRSNSYSQRYAYTKAARTGDRECVPSGKEHEMYPAIYTTDTALPWALPLPGCTAAQKVDRDASQPGTAVHGAQKYSTAQLLNSRTRTTGSQGGALPVVSVSQPVTPATVKGQDHVLNPTEQALLAQLLSSMSSRLTVQAPQGQSPAVQVSKVAASSATSGVTSTEPAVAEQLLAQQKAEGLLDQTQSVPFELLGSPRSRLYLSSSQLESGPVAPAAQRLLALLAGTGKEGPVVQALADAVAMQSSNAGMTKTHNATNSSTVVDRSRDSASSDTTSTSHPGNNQSMVMNILRPGASTPHIPDTCGTTCTATPDGSSHVLIRPAPSTTRVKNSCTTTPSTLETPETPVPAVTGSSTGPSFAAGVTTTTGSSSCGVLSHSSTPGSLSFGSRSDSDDGSVSASEVLSLLFDTELTPEVKAERMAKLYSRTMSKHNMRPNNLQQTLAEVSSAMLASASASGVSAEPLLLQQQQQHQQTAQEVQAASSTPDNSEELTSNGHAQDINLVTDELQSSRNIQELLLRMSAEGTSEK